MRYDAKSDRIIQPRKAPPPLKLKPSKIHPCSCHRGVVPSWDLRPSKERNDEILEGGHTKEKQIRHCRLLGSKNNGK